jgi:hypothetical protein
MITLESEHSGDDAVAVATRSTVLLVGGNGGCDFGEVGERIHLSDGGFWWWWRSRVVAWFATEEIGVASMGVFIIRGCSESGN